MRCGCGGADFNYEDGDLVCSICGIVQSGQGLEGYEAELAKEENKIHDDVQNDRYHDFQVNRVRLLRIEAAENGAQRLLDLMAVRRCTALKNFYVGERSGRRAVAAFLETEGIRRRASQLYVEVMGGGSSYQDGWHSQIAMKHCLYARLYLEGDNERSVASTYNGSPRLMDDKETEAKRKRELRPFLKKFNWRFVLKLLSVLSLKLGEKHCPQQIEAQSLAAAKESVSPLVRREMERVSRACDVLEIDPEPFTEIRVSLAPFFIFEKEAFRTEKMNKPVVSPQTRLEALYRPRLVHVAAPLVYWIAFMSSSWGSIEFVKMAVQGYMDEESCQQPEPESCKIEDDWFMSFLDECDTQNDTEIEGPVCEVQSLPVNPVRHKPSPPFKALTLVEADLNDILKALLPAARLVATHMALILSMQKLGTHVAGKSLPSGMFSNCEALMAEDVLPQVSCGLSFQKASDAGRLGSRTEDTIMILLVAIWILLQPLCRAKITKRHFSLTFSAVEPLSLSLFGFISHRQRAESKFRGLIRSVFRAIDYPEASESLLSPIRVGGEFLGEPLLEVPRMVGIHLRTSTCMAAFLEALQSQAESVDPEAYKEAGCYLGWDGKAALEIMRDVYDRHGYFEPDNPALDRGQFDLLAKVQHRSFAAIEDISFGNFKKKRWLKIRVANYGLRRQRYRRRDGLRGQRYRRRELNNTERLMVQEKELGPALTLLAEKDIHVSITGEPLFQLFRSQFHQIYISTSELDKELVAEPHDASDVAEAIGRLADRMKGN